MVSADVSGVGRVAEWEWDALLRPKGQTFANGAGGSVSRTFEDSDDVDALTHTFVGGPLSIDHGYDRSRKLTSKLESLAGYRRTGPTVGTTSYVPDRLNRYTSVGGTPLTYQAGLMTSDGAGGTFGYDAENRLLTASTPLGSGAYTYDPTGRRVAKSVGGAPATGVLHAGEEEVAAYSATGVLQRKWIPGPEIDRMVAQVDEATGALTYYRHDRLGSTLAMTNASGQVVEGPYTYDVYGQPNVTTGTPFKYTGRRYDPETGLYYYRARFYHPKLGRFLQTDPIGQEDDLNLYAYVANNPANITDPSGTCGVFVRQCVGAAWGAGIELAVQLSDKETRKDYGQAFEALRSGDLSGAWDAAGSHVASVGSAGLSGAIGAKVESVAAKGLGATVLKGWRRR